MNNQEAKFILSAYRANGVDANDEVFAEALQQARQDPALGAWMARQQAHDTEVVRKLREIAPPAGLRDAILTGAKVSDIHPTQWRQPFWIALGAAAAVLIVASLAFWRDSGAAQSRALLEFALNDTARGHHGDGGEAVAAAQTWLSDPQTKLSAGLPVEFADLGKVGCRTLLLNGAEVFEICFHRNGTWFHLYATRLTPPDDSRNTNDVVMNERDQLSGALWRDPKFGYMYALVGDVGLEQLKRLL
jgi:hypothetical protein